MIKINGQVVERELFPNNEMLVHTDFLNNLTEPFDIHFSFWSNEDLIELFFVVAHLKDIRKTDFNLYVHYMPYSRMDRNQNGNCFSLKHVTDLIKVFVRSGLNKTYVVEPHSDVTLDLMNAERINAITPLMNKILELHSDIDVICYPDKGAKARFCDDTVNLPVVYCEKVRDFDTGEIKGLELQGDIDLNGKNVLILDDLCSKGGTFYHTANKLHEAGAKDVYLGVCHMEISVKDGKICKGTTERTSPIKEIYCFDTMLPDIPKGMLEGCCTNITIFSINKFLEKNIVEI